MQLIIENNIIEAYVRFGEIQGGIDFDEKSLPEKFYEKFKPSFYMLQNDEIVENPNYVAPEPPVIGPSKQEKINAQLMLNQATQKQTQDAFNSQVLLQLAKLGGTK
ncbi:DUF2977 domain-containing protein [Pediococcus pentosaceus]|uniref:DUF2977 domain-containing protein n=1 Tax=Pediococcus pentosaceus TaxID=1255 RepID=UPI002FEEDD4A